MPILQAVTEIDAPADRVWEILSDVGNYPRWNPFIRGVSGRLAVGETIEVYLALAPGRIQKFTPRVTAFQPGREIRWLGRLWQPHVFDGEHRLLIEPLDEARVRFTQREVFRGVLVPLLLAAIGKDTQRGFVEMNQALKAEAEGEREPEDWFRGG
jgi:hypothetical protein